MPPRGPPSEKEIWRIARRTTDIIQDHITSDVCLFGSAAASLWADTGRVPNDIDIVVSHGDAESIKRIIVDVDDRYFLEDAKRRDAPYKKLFCCLPGWNAYGRSVKVDILVPPMVNIPNINSYDTVIINRIPVMPLFDLLIMKTQGWWDHRRSPREDFHAKEEGDVADIDGLLDRAIEEQISYQDEIDAYRHTSEFLKRALTLVRKFAGQHGRWEKWEAIGFPL